MRRIIFACQSLTGGNGGIARVDRLITSVLREAFVDYRVEVHVFSDAPNEAREESLPFPVYHYNGSRVRFTLGLWRSMRKRGYWIYDAAYLARAHPPGWVGRRRPFMVFLHGIEIWEQANPSSIVACREAHRLVANSHYTLRRAQRAHAGFPDARICWLGTETDGSPSGSRFASSPDLATVLVVGRMDAREGYKGHDALIRAWPDVLKAHPQVRLEIVGRGTLVADLQKLAVACGVAREVIFRGFISEEELAACYARARLFALPSRGEGFGLVYIEAMRHGLPVIASRHDAGGEVVSDGETGMLADLERPGDLAAKLVTLLSQASTAEVMGKAGQVRWQNHFTYGAFRGRFQRILNDALGDIR